MNIILKLLLLLFSTSCFSQVLIEKSIGGELDITNQKFTVEINNEVISGVLNENKIKDYRFYTIKNDGKMLVFRLGKDIESVNTEMELLKLKNLENTKILDIYYLEESFTKIKKTIKRNEFEGLKSLNLIFSSNNYGGVWKTLYTNKDVRDNKDLGLVLLKSNGTPISGVLIINSDEDRYGRIESHYKNGKQEGPFEEYHLNGNLKMMGHYKNGQRIGIWTDYYDNGQLQNEGNYQNDQKEGLWKRYIFGAPGNTGPVTTVLEKNYKDGQLEGFSRQYYKGNLSWETIYKNGKREGLSVWYDDINGQVRSEENYRDDQMEGLSKWYHENGQLQREGNYQNGQRIGIWRDYHDNGQLESEGNYKDGQKEGWWREYHENGQLESEVKYIDGKKEGLWRVYHSNGHSQSKGQYKNGHATGLWRYYYDNGNLEMKGNYKNSQKDGLWKHYGYDGSMFAEETYEEGLPVF